VSEVRESWGWKTRPLIFANVAYGAKVDFVSGGLGYVGDPYVLQGDALGEPLSLIREDGRLEAA